MFDAGIIKAKMLLKTGEWMRSASSVDKTQKKMAGQAKKTGTAFGGMWKQMAMGLGVAGGMTMAIRSISRQIGDTIRKGREFEKEWANVTTMLTISTKETRKMRRELRYLSPILGDTTDLAKGMYQVLSASIEPAKAIKFLAEAAKSAKAGMTDTKTSVDALTTVINAYGKEAEEVTAVSDIMFQTVKRGKLTYDEMANSLGTVVPVAATVGIRFEEIAAAVATLTRQGINAQTATMQLRQVMMSILKPTQQAIDMAEHLEIEFTATALRTKGLSKFLAELKEKTGGSAALLAQLVPNVRALTGVMALAGKQSEAFAYDLHLMGEAAGTTDVAFQKQMESLDFWIETAGTAADKIKLSFYEGFSRPIKASIKNSKDLDAELKKLMGSADTLGAVTGTVTTQGIDSLSQSVKDTSASVGALKMVTEGIILTIKNKKLLTLKNVTKAWAENQNQLMENAKQLAKMRNPYIGFAGILAKQAKALQDRVHWIMESSASTDEAIDRLREYRDQLKEAAAGELSLNEELGVSADYFGKAAVSARVYQMELLALNLELDKWKLPELVKTPAELMSDIGFTDLGPEFEYQWGIFEASYEEKQTAFQDSLLASVGLGLQATTGLTEDATEQQLTAMDKIGVGMQAMGSFGKEAALASALWNTYQGVSKTIAQLGMPWALPFIPIALAAGFKQVAGIKKKSVPALAEGAVFERPTYMVGEGREAEVLSPLSKLPELFARTVGAEAGDKSMRVIIQNKLVIGEQTFYKETVKSVNLGGKRREITIPISQVV